MRKGVVAFAFGAPDKIPPNRRIAQMAIKKLLSIGGHGIFTQEDMPIFRDPNIRVIPDDPKSGGPPTLRIAREAVQWAIEQRIGILWIACAEPHVWRCERDLRYAVAEAGATISVLVCEEAHEKGGWFCAESTQPRTQHRDAWKNRESILRVLPMFIYTRVVS